MVPPHRPQRKPVLAAERGCHCGRQQQQRQSNDAGVAAGMISFLSACVLPLVPAYVSYVTGKPIEDDRITARYSYLRVLAASLLFVLGFSLAFVTLGASATAVGSLLLRYKYEATIAGVVMILMGLAMITGYMSAVAYWMLRTFPALGQIG